MRRWESGNAALPIEAETVYRVWYVLPGWEGNGPEFRGDVPAIVAADNAKAAPARLVQELKDEGVLREGQEYFVRVIRTEPLR